VEQQHDYAVLQSKLDKRRKLSHDLKVKLGTCMPPRASHWHVN
jgi:hypothetical protein